ncbi:acyl-CoA synthetase [Mycolicibacterium cosmeticum]|uniref:acyl-CoA synthetase n=1 Tax=Mycolicibacterium cosmeticum TaxID=258533 RepID=UPI003204E6A3
MNADPLWPEYRTPADIADIEAVPLSERGLPSSTYEILCRGAALYPDRSAVTVIPDAQRWLESRTRTFAELLGDVHQLANLLRACGVGRHDAVALLAPNCDELLTATLAAQLAGIAAPINAGLSADHVGELIDRAGARVLITAAPELDSVTWDLASRLAAAGVVDTVFLLSPTNQPAGPAPSLAGVTVDYASRCARAHRRDGFDGAPPQAGDLAALFHTGGTTGAPKLAAHTHANEVANAWMVAANSTLDEDGVIFAALPLFHVNALIVTVLAPLMRGQHVVWAGPLGYRDPHLYGVFWKIVEHHRISAMSAVPTVYAVLAHCHVDADISSMRFAVVGASALPSAVRKDFEQHTGITLVEGYGLTEATCASARSFPDHPRPGTVGQRLPYVGVRVVDLDAPGGWRDVPAGQAGTLIVNGPTVFAGYVDHRAADGTFVLDGRGKLVDGWLDTGDLARIDTDGFVHLTGRAKDLIIRGGHNIDPAVIEDALLAHPEVTAAAAVGAPDTHAGEVPVAYVTLAPGSTATPTQLRDWAIARVTERAAAPKDVSIIDALPVTAIGKPYKPTLRADAARRVVGEALAGLPGVTVDAEVEDGSPVLTVFVPDTAQHADVEHTLGRYSVGYRMVRT